MPTTRRHDDKMEFLIICFDFIEVVSTSGSEERAAGVDSVAGMYCNWVAAEDTRGDRRRRGGSDEGGNQVFRSQQNYRKSTLDISQSS